MKHVGMGIDMERGRDENLEAIGVAIEQAKHGDIERCLEQLDEQPCCHIRLPLPRHYHTRILHHNHPLSLCRRGYIYISISMSVLVWF